MKLWQYAVIVFLGGCCFGVLSTFVKLAYAAGFSLAEVTGSQFLFGTMLIWTIVLFTKKVKINRKQSVQLLLSGAPMGLTGVFYYQSLQTLEASLAIIFLFQFVWIGTLLEWGIAKKTPTKSKLVAITILLLGSALASGVLREGVASLSWQGAVWGMLAAITFATFIYVSGSVGQGLPPVFKSAMLSSGGLIVVLLLFPPLFLGDLSVLVGVAPYGMFLGLFGVALPPLLFSIGMPQVGPGLGTILSAAELPVAVIMSAVVLAEVVTFLQWIGVLLILLAITFANIGTIKGHNRDRLVAS
ncbi:EamA family transporter [Desertibacillus haloalkaliphilus]|uniref:EamA family transporter n=1 Tax=Desertibacillus haloalkaliphilus TaxID=1328930 RepID=UPI001C26BF79|nr:DMT family transporter [Desertibacillus haloalkaliphilus]MBU8907586.1 DMT family transporter [Desertibacillus haloalkaliphilus]